MARYGETEHGSAEPNGVPPFAATTPRTPDALHVRVVSPSPPPPRASSSPPDYPPPPYPEPPDSSPPPYPPSSSPPPAYPPLGAHPPPGGNRTPDHPHRGDLSHPAGPHDQSPTDSGWSGAPPSLRAQPLFDAPANPPATKNSAAFWLLVGFVGFVVGQVVGTIFIAIAASIAGESGEVSKFASMSAPPEWYVGTSLVGIWVGFFLGPWVASKMRGTGRFLHDMGLRFRPIDLVGILIGVAGQYVLTILYRPFNLKHFTAPTQKLVGASHGWGFLVIAILTVCGAPFFEEILFRGLALKAFVRLFAPAATDPTRRRAVGIIMAVVVDGVLFGLAHWELYQFAGLALFGMLLATVSYKTGRLGMNMLAHASFNLVAVLAVLQSSGGVVH